MHSAHSVHRFPALSFLQTARTGYATQRALFISTQLHVSDTASVVRKVWVLISLWKQHSVQARASTRDASAPGKRERKKGREKKEKKKEKKKMPSRLRRFWFISAGVSSMGRYKQNKTKQTNKQTTTKATTTTTTTTTTKSV